MSVSSIVTPSTTNTNTPSDRSLPERLKHPYGGRTDRIRCHRRRRRNLLGSIGIVGRLTFLSLFVVVVFCSTYVHRRQRRARLPKNLQHFEMSKEIRHWWIEMQTTLQWSAKTSQQVDERLFLAPNPRATFVLHLIRCYVHVNLYGKTSKCLE